MNRYQEVLNRIIDDDYSFPHDHYDEDKATVKEHDINMLQELVEKATPKKPVLDEIWKDDYTTIYDECGFINASIYVCLNCRKHTIYNSEYGAKFKHCTNCGQAIDWGDEND